MLFGVDLATVGILVLAAAVAGMVDAAIGGGGLIQLPIILIAAPGLANAQALGLNKISSFLGTVSAAITMVRRVPQARVALRWVPVVAIGSGLGALCASLLSKELFRPIIIVAMLVVGVFVVARPQFGQGAGLTSRGRLGLRTALVVTLVVACIGFYDGIFGPGTGMFLIIALTGLLGSNFVESTAMTKVLNAATNFGAIVVFAIHGEQLWLLGLVMGVANMLGAQVGARFVLAKGARTVRVLLLVLVVVMAVKLGWDQWA